MHFNILILLCGEGLGYKFVFRVNFSRTKSKDVAAADLGFDSHIKHLNMQECNHELSVQTLIK